MSNVLKWVCLSSWLCLALYLALHLTAGVLHPTLKELPISGSLTEQQRTIDQWQTSPLTRMQRALAPVWARNRVIYPSLAALCLVLTAVAWATQRRFARPKRA